MAAEFGHDITPLSYGHMRAAQADRERAVDVLKAAFAEGRIDQDEYTGRVGQVYKSRTYAELAAITADLPVGPLGTFAPPLQPPMPVPYQRPVYLPARHHPRLHPVLAIILVLILLGAIGDGLLAVLAAPVLAFIMIILITGRARR